MIYNTNRYKYTYILYTPVYCFRDVPYNIFHPPPDDMF